MYDLRMHSKFIFVCLLRELIMIGCYWDDCGVIIILFDEMIWDIELMD